MSRLRSHVDELFKGYKQDQHIRELKEEILSNLEAKVADLTADGMNHSEAVQTAIESMDRIDFLIDHNKKIYINKYKLELLQTALLYTVIAWVLTIPVLITGMGRTINSLMLIISLILGGFFLVLNHQRNNKSYHDVSYVNVKTAARRTKLAWIIWSLFILISIGSVSALRFGSNLWFGRPITIDGPYQFAVLIIQYALPFPSLIIPLLFSASSKLLSKYEVGDDDE